MGDQPVVRVPVHRRFSDLDVLGHVNNVVFHDYLQEGRVGILRGLSDIHSDEYAQVVVTQEIHHVKPLLLDPAPVIVEVWVSRLGNSSYTIGYRILDEHGDVAATATTVMAIVSPATGRPIRIPPHLRQALVPLLAD